MLRDSYRKHIWMVQTRDSQMAADEKTAAGVPELIDREWTDALKGPVWGKRALWHERDMENAFTEVRTINIETGRAY
jgi:hypothetical protein